MNRLSLAAASIWRLIRLAFAWRSHGEQQDVVEVGSQVLSCGKAHTQVGNDNQVVVDLPLGRNGTLSSKRHIHDPVSDAKVQAAIEVENRSMRPIDHGHGGIGNLGLFFAGGVFGLIDHDGVTRSYGWNGEEQCCFPMTESSPARRVSA